MAEFRTQKITQRTSDPGRAVIGSRRQMTDFWFADWIWGTPLVVLTVSVRAFGPIWHADRIVGTLARLLRPQSVQASFCCGWRPGRSGGGCHGLTVSRVGDDLDPVLECHTENEFWQLVVTIETTPALTKI